MVVEVSNSPSAGLKWFGVVLGGDCLMEWLLRVLMELGDLVSDRGCI